jgi:hypothetical protein
MEQVSRLEKGKGRKGNYNPNIQKIDENSESFRNFIRRFRNSPETKKAYAHWLRRFVEYSNIPDVRKQNTIFSTSYLDKEANDEQCTIQQCFF